MIFSDIYIKKDFMLHKILIIKQNIANTHIFYSETLNTDVKIKIAKISENSYFKF